MRVVVCGTFSGRGTSSMENPHRRRSSSRWSRWSRRRKLSSFAAGCWWSSTEKSNTEAATGTLAVVRLIHRLRVRSLKGSSPPAALTARCMVEPMSSLIASETKSSIEETVARPNHNSAGNRDLVGPVQNLRRKTGRLSKTLPLQRSMTRLRYQVPWYRAQSGVPHESQTRPDSRTRDPKQKLPLVIAER